MTKQQDFSMWSVNFIFVLPGLIFLYYGAFICIFRYCRSMWERCYGTPADISWLVALLKLSSFFIIRPYLGKLAPTNGVVARMLLGTIFALLFLLFGRVGRRCRWSHRLAHGVCLAMYLAASAAHSRRLCAGRQARRGAGDLSDPQCGFYGCFSSSRHLDTSAYTKLSFFVQRLLLRH